MMKIMKTETNEEQASESLIFQRVEIFVKMQESKPMPNLLKNGASRGII
jgi:hypothetical protein